jgi:hypothetical protein
MWIYNDLPVTPESVPAEAFGFIYRITNKQTGKFYIGRKTLTKAKTRILKGKKLRSRVSSDWQDYWSSSPHLLEEISSVGKDSFRREILCFAYTKGSLSYLEEKYLYVLECLERDDCYNGNIRARVMKSWVKRIPQEASSSSIISSSSSSAPHNGQNLISAPDEANTENSSSHA